MIDTQDIKEYIDFKIDDAVNRLSSHLDNVIAEERMNIMSRIKQQVVIDGSKVWVTGEDIKSLLQNCISACMKSRTSLSNTLQRTLFVPYAERFFSLYKEQQEELTKQTRRNIFRTYVIPKFSDIYIENITVNDIQEWFNELAKDRSHETLLKIKNVMSPVFNAAVEDRLIEFNPFKSSRLVIGGTSTIGHKAIPKYKLKYIKENIDILDDRERKLCTLLTYTGMRFEECLGLKYEDISDDNIFIQRAVVHPTRNLAEVKLPKTKTSIRKIPCHSEVKRVLGTGEGFVLCNKSGNPLSYTEARRSFDKIRKAFGLEGFSAHDFRDTCATEWREKGMSLDVIARLLGHAKTETTEKRYVKYRDDILDQARALM